MSADTLATLDALFKEQYLEKGLQEVMPEHTPLMSGVPFVGQKEKSGRELVFPILISREHGFTALGQTGLNQSLRAATTAQIREARVVSYGYMGRTQIDTMSIARAIGDAQAFVNTVQYKVKNLQTSFAVSQEIGLLYGQDGLGTVASGSEADGTYGGVVFTNGISGNKIKIASKEFGDHIWIGSEGMPVDIYTAAGVLVLSTVISSYDEVSEWLELESVAGLTDPQGYVIYRAGYKGNEGAGLMRIMKQTSSSTPLYSIDSATAPLWRTSQYNVADQYLSFEMLAEGVSRAVGRGLASKATLHVHPQVFASLMPDFNTIKATGADFKSRSFVSGGDVKELEHGAVALRFYVGSVTLDVLANPFVKKGYAMLVAQEELKRVGSSDVTYDIPGQSEGGKYWRTLENIAAYELRIFADQALMSTSLNQHLLFSGIKIDAPPA